MTTLSTAGWKPRVPITQSRNGLHRDRSRSQVAGAGGERAGPRAEVGRGDPVARFKQAEKDLIQVAGLADFDPQAKARSAELRDEMKRASQEIARDPARMRAAEREGFAPRSDQKPA